MVRGQLLVIPIADRIIYVEALYLQSEVLAFPELKKVILADGNDVVMADSVDQALEMLIDGDSDLIPATTEGKDPILELDDLDEIETAIIGIGDAVQELQEVLERLRESVGGRSP